MKIIHLACVAPPQTGGMGKSASEEAVRLNAAGQEAILIAPSKTDWKFGNAAILNRRELMKSCQDADIIHLHYPFYGTAGFVAKLRRAGKIKKLVITLHMDATASGWKGMLFNLHRRFFQARILNSADVLLCSSRDYAVNSSFSNEKESARLIELPFGVDAETFSPGPSDNRFGIPAEARVIGFVGGMDTAHAFKGVDILLKAFARCPLNTHLLLAGDGDLRPSFEKLAQELDIADRCHFVGRVSDAQLVDVYRASDVFAFPSTSSAEAFGLVALEAQACGIPVVASDLSGVRTVVHDKVTGFLIPPSDVDELAAHLRLLLENPSMRQGFGSMARERVLEKFTWEAHMEKLLGIYYVLNRTPAK